ncbi:MAG: TonB-dependent receptor [Maricaulaceae bacterium]
MNTTFKSVLLSGAVSASSLIIAASLATPAFAQVTTSSVQGYVTNENGNPLSNATVILTNTASGFTRTANVDANGSFSLRNLPVTGAYNVVVTSEGYQGERVEDIQLSLGGTTALNFTLSGGSREDEIIVVAQRQVLADVAVGPSASFGQVTIENAPAINRNIADIIRLDPRVYVDESRGDINSVQCVGQSSRFNSITLDGVAVNDSFGLNSNGYPTERMPFPFDAIEQVSVEIAPYDVKYGGFTACAINSVTKSGTNEFHGGAFFDYTSDGLRGKRVDGEKTNFDDFDEIRYGINVGGPIIKDKLFFNIAYEKLEGANTYNTNTVGNGPFQISQNQLDEIASIAQSVYQYNPGFIPSSFDNQDEKLLVKLDWNINSNHRATATFDYNDGNNIVRSDGDSDEIEFSNHLYERGSKLESYVGALYSDWTDNFSTELRVGYLSLDGRQESLGGTDFGEMQIDVDDVTVYIGSDDSRQSNDLNYNLLDLSLRANYDWNNHSFSAGIERKDLDIFNLFVQHTETEIRFSSIEDFRNGAAREIYYNNAPSHNPNDAAADWGYALNTVYGQDEFTIGDSLNVVAGLRYDWYTSSDKPTENPGFTADYGFSNAQNFDGVGLLQPRVGFTYDAEDNLQFRGGVGLYSGGNPNVWLSNNYSANNVTQVGDRLRDRPNGLDLFSYTYAGAENGVPNAPGYAIPQQMFDSVSTGQGRNFEINYLDPDFKIPSDWKYSIGATWAPDFQTDNALFGGEWQLQADLMWSKAKDTAIILRGDLVQDGTRVVDGVTYPTYDSPLTDSFVLTNSTESNKSFVASLGASKKWDNGVAITLGYAYSDAKDVQPMTSSVAFSNYNNRAYTDPQEQILSTSNYNTKHRFTGSWSYTKAFWKEYDTNIFAFVQSSSGRPYSRTQDGVANSIYNFTPFLGNGGDSILAPGTERNEFTGPSWTKVDLKITQELPGFRADDRASVFMVIDNLTNLLNDGWGVLDEPSFPRTLREGQPFSRNFNASAYEIRFGAKYQF